MTTLTDTQVVNASGGLVELGYSQITAAVTINNGTAGTGVEVIAPLTVVCDGTPILIEFFSPEVRPHSASGYEINVSLFEDGAEKIRSWGRSYNGSSSYDNKPMQLQTRITPSAGSHTYSVKAYVTNTSPSTNTGYVGAGSGTTGAAAAFLRVSKIVEATQWPAVTTGTIICTSSTRPAAPFEGQRIYETDTNKEWVYDGAAWYTEGLQGKADLTSSQSGITTVTDLTGGSLTFTAVASRLYRICGQVLIGASGANTAAQLAIRDGSTTIGASISSIVSGEYETIFVSRIIEFSSGSKTVKLSLLRQSGAGTLFTTLDSVRPDYISVEDIGPA